MSEAYERYLRHQKGLALLWLWFDQWRHTEPLKYKVGVLELSPLVSQRFAVGVPRAQKKITKSIRQSGVFLGVQHEEQKWLKRIEWSKMVLDASSSVLWLISATHRSPDESWPDLPPTAVGLQINPETFEGWTGRSMEWRSVWWDDDNVSHVDAQVGGVWRVVRGTLEEKWSEDERLGVRSLKDIVNERIAQTNVYHDPGFSGSLPTLPKEFEKVANPDVVLMDIKSSPEFSKPELFGQFLEEQPLGKKK